MWMRLALGALVVGVCNPVLAQDLLFSDDFEDGYRYSVNDSSHVFDPTPRAELSAIPAGSDYTLCAYIECSDLGVTADNLECTSGSSASFDGLPGCCSNQFGSSSERVTFTYRCDTDPAPVPDDESGTVYVRVSYVSGGVTCNNYMLEWGDDS